MAEAPLQEQNPPEREDLEDANEQENEDLLAAMAENPSEFLSEVPSEDMDDDEMLSDDSLSSLERIFLHVKSDATIHRVFIARELPMLLQDVEISEAVEYVLPWINSLGTDPDDSVREAFAPELDKIIWFYYSHCPLKEPSPDLPTNEKDALPRPQTPQGPPTPRERPQTPTRSQTPQTPKPEPSLLPPRSQTPSNPPYLSPQAFTPLLHALLLDQNASIATSAQNVVLSLVEKIFEDTEVTAKDKELLEKETLEGVVLGIGRLDQERAKREETGEWEAENDDQSVGGVAGSEEEAELGRMTMMTLITSLVSIVGPERATRLFVPELDKLAEEPVFYVRKEAAMAVGGLASIVPLDVITSKLLPIYDHFSADNIWHVRRSCCLVLPTICSRLPPDMKADRAMKGIELFAGDVSRSVRSTAGEIIGELIATFHPVGDVPEGLVQHFLNLGPLRDGPTDGNNNATNNYAQRDPEKPVICAFNFPAVVLTLGADRWDDLKETYNSLTRDMQIKVRRSLACSLHEIAKVIGPQKTEQDLLSVFSFYLVDTDEVKSGLMEHLAAFIECLPQHARNEFLPSLNDVWDGVKHQWRLRDEIAKQLPELCRLFDCQSVVNHILPLTIRAVKDDVASVRETAVVSFPNLFDAVRNDEVYYKELINHVKQFSSESGFRRRVVYVQICNALVSSDSVTKAEFESEFLPALESLVSDSVVNVRIAVGRLVGELCQLEQWYVNPTNRPPIIVDLIQSLGKDSDVNVRGFVYSLLPPEEKTPVPEERTFVPSTKAISDNSETGQNNINDQNFFKSKQDADMVIDVPELENGDSESSDAVMGEIPITLIRHGDPMDVDTTENKVSTPQKAPSSLSNPTSPNSNNTQISTIANIETDQSLNTDEIPILLSDTTRLLRDQDSVSLSKEEINNTAQTNAEDSKIITNKIAGKNGSIDVGSENVQQHGGDNTTHGQSSPLVDKSTVSPVINFSADTSMEPYSNSIVSTPLHETNPPETRMTLSNSMENDIASSINTVSTPTEEKIVNGEPENGERKASHEETISTTVPILEPNINLADGVDGIILSEEKRS